MAFLLMIFLTAVGTRWHDDDTGPTLPALTPTREGTRAVGPSRYGSQSSDTPFSVTAKFAPSTKRCFEALRSKTFKKR